MTPVGFGQDDAETVPVPPVLGLTGGPEGDSASESATGHTAPRTQVLLGRRYRDRITGYIGIATARTTYLHDLPSVRLTRADENGKPECEWFAEAALDETSGM